MRFFSGTYVSLSGVYTNAPIGAARETCRKAQKQAVELEMNAVDTFRAPRPLPRGIVTMNTAASELEIIEDTGLFGIDVDLLLLTQLESLRFQNISSARLHGIEVLLRKSECSKSNAGIT